MSYQPRALTEAQWCTTLDDAGGAIEDAVKNAVNEFDSARRRLEEHDEAQRTEIRELTEALEESREELQLWERDETKLRAKLATWMRGRFTKPSEAAKTACLLADEIERAVDVPGGSAACEPSHDAGGCIACVAARAAGRAERQAEIVALLRDRFLPMEDYSPRAIGAVQDLIAAIERGEVLEVKP